MRTGRVLVRDERLEVGVTLDLLAAVVAARMGGDDVLAVEDAHPQRVGAHGEGASHMGVGDRVVVQVEAHVRGLARRHRAQLVGRKRCLGPREQALALGREGLGHRHRGVLGAAPRTGGALAPGLGLRVQVVQIGEGASGEEGLAHVADRALDAPLLVAARHRHRARLEAVVAGEREQGRVEADRVAATLEHRALQIVVEGDARHRAPALEGADMAAQEVLHARIEEEAQIDLARPRQHHDEGHQRTARAPDRQVPEVPPVDLGLLAGQGA